MVWSIRNLLVGLFALLALVTGVQGAITIESLVRIERSVDGVAHRNLPSGTAVHDIQHAFEKLRTKQFRLVLTTAGADVIANNIREVSDARDDVASKRRAYERFIDTAAEREAYDGFVASWTSYSRLTEPVEMLMRAGRGDEAQHLLTSPWLRVLARTVESQLSRDVSLNASSAADAAAQTLESVGQARLGALAMVTLAALLAAAASAASYLRVVRPLEALTTGLGRLAAGDVGTPLECPSRNDEIGAMTAALTVFRASLIRTREAEDERRHTQQFIEKVAETTPDGIIGLDEDGIVTFWNTSVEHLVGFAAEEMLGQPVAQVTTGANHLSREMRLRRWYELVGRTVDSEMVHKDGTLLPVELSFGRWQQDGRDMFCAIVRDGRARKAHEEILHHLAHVDALTHLPNRTVLIERMDAAFRAKRPITVLMADLDRFKQVNELLGHRIGDAVLLISSERLLACVDAADTVTRIGGDEFVMVLDGVGDPRRAAATAEAIIASLSQPFTVEGRTIHLSSSVGIAIAPSHADNADDLLSCADLALHAAKSDGRHAHRLFTHDMRRRAAEENDCRQELARAVEQGEFRLFYQPQIRLSDGALMGAEALIRWQHPVRGLLLPGRFLNVLENSRHAAEVGEWVIRTACRQVATWRQVAPHFRMGVNLSSSQFRAGTLADTVLGCLTEASLPGSALEVEITENIILGHDQALVEPLKRLRAADVGIAFDDYGTGYASLSVLKRFPLTRLKIDRSFVQDIDGAGTNAAIIRAVLMLGHSLGLDVIAEGVESMAQLEWLKRKRCAEGQGFLFGQPMPADEFARRFGLDPEEAARSAA